MTTATFTHHHHDGEILLHLAPVRRAYVEAAVAAVAFVLLLPGAALLMSVLA